MANISLLGGVFTIIGDIVSGFFAIIPQFMYFLYASAASLLDLFQFLFRKLAGLDTYYYDGQAQNADPVTKFIEGILGIDKSYSALNTVFWSMIIFGCIVLVLMTIFTLIKAHYNYDSKKSQPSYIIKNTLKAIATMAIIPLTTIFGLYVGSSLFKALDTITAHASTESLENVYESEAIAKFNSGATTENGGGERYASYDFFGFKEYSNTESFSGKLFLACTNSANRVRYGAYSVGGETFQWDNMGIFYTSKDTNKLETIASQIDYAFMNNLSLKNKTTVKLVGSEDKAAIAMTLTFGPSATFAAGLVNVKSFSKFNVGLVWYYYNLWAFNFLIAFIGVFLCLTLFTNVLFGLILRIIITSMMFLVYPALVGIMPFDEGNAIKSWRGQFISYVVSAYASIVGMNIMFLLLPVVDMITFFNSTFLNAIMQIIVLIAALTMVKKFVDIVSNFIGAKDLNSLGASAKSDSSKPVMKGLGGAVAVGGASIALAKAPLVAFSQTKTGKELASNISQMSNEVKRATREKFQNSRVGKAVAKVKSSKFANSLSRAKTKTKAVFNRAGQKAGRFFDTGVGKFIASRFGLPVDPHSSKEYVTHEVLDEDGNVKLDASGNPIMVTQQLLGQDEDGKPIYGKEKPKKLSLIKNAVVDISKTTFGALLDITNSREMVEKLDKSTDVIDAFRRQINSLAESIQRLGGASQPKPVLKTKAMKKAKEKREKHALGPVVEFKDVSSYADMAKAVEELVNEWKKH